MIRRKLILLFMPLSFYAGCVFAQPPAPPALSIDSAFIDKNDNIDLTGSISYFIEHNKTTTIEDILVSGSKVNFKPGFDELSADSLQGNFWVSFALRNNTTENLSLRLYFVSDKLDLYLLDSNHQIKTMHGGYILPYGQWPSMNKIPRVFDPNSYPFTIAPHTTIDLFVRSEPIGLSSPEFDGISLITEKAYLEEMGEQNATTNTFQLVFCGMTLMMILFSLSLFAINRDKTYLFYCLYSTCVMYYLMASLGFERLYLFGSDVGFNMTGFNLSVYGIGIFYGLFAIYFLHQRGWKPKLKKWMRYYIYFSLFCAIISSIYLIVQPQITRSANTVMNAVNMPSSILGILLMLYINIVYLRSKNKTARYFALAGLSLILGFTAVLIVNLLRVTNVLADASSSQVDNMTLAFIYEAGFLMQIFLFALALSYRSRLIEKEKTELEVMDTTKARFFANISHEFKTPLTLILGPAAELSKKTNDIYFKNTLSIIEKNAKRLLGLITEIMDLSKLDAGKMKLQLLKNDIIDFIQKQTLLFMSQAESKKIRLAFTSSIDRLDMAFDPDKIQKVISNLLSNACKFTPPGGTISIKTGKVTKLDRGFLWIEVRDTGTGISSEHLPHIFERFYHSNQKNYTTDQPSTGIGLALTKELVTMHEGSIEAASKINQGTTITILLPVELTPADDKVPNEEFTVAFSPEDNIGVPVLVPGITNHTPVNAQSDLPEILLIEDNDDLRGYIRSCLPGYLVGEAGDGEEGIQKAIKNIPDLVITDVMMPKKDGFEVCRELKQNEKTNHIPVIILTGKSSQSSRLEGLQTEADVYLSKPFDADELRLQINNLLKNRQRMQEHYSKKLFLETTHQEVTSVEEEFLQKALKVVDENLSDENFSVDQLSRALFMDRTQLFRKLKALTDQNPSNFVRNLRLKKAKYMLEHNAGTVSDIAFAVGFGSTTYFNKCFKELYGESPGKIKA